jgi:hypothetical protein
MIATPANWLGICESLKSVRSERAAQMELGEESSQGPCAELRRRASVLDQAVQIRVVRVKGFFVCVPSYKKDSPQPVSCFHLSGAHSSPSVMHQAQRLDWELALNRNLE